MRRSIIPGVLATVAAYNAAFGRKFDELFAKALTEIKTFGQALEEMGGTILSTVDGVEVTVEHVAAIEGTQMLQADYGSAFEKFRRVSKLKKELDRRPPIRRSLLTPSRARREFGELGQRRRCGCKGSESCGRESSGKYSRLSAAHGHRAADRRRREQAAPRGRIDSRFRARRRPQVPPGRAHALLQPDADDR